MRTAPKSKHGQRRGHGHQKAKVSSSSDHRQLPKSEAFDGHHASSPEEHPTAQLKKPKEFDNTIMSILAVVKLQSAVRARIIHQRMSKDPTHGKSLDLQLAAASVSCLRPTADQASFAFTCMDLQGKQVVNLDAVQAYQNLLDLDVSSNLLQNLRELMHLPHLTRLNARCNLLTRCLDFRMAAGGSKLQYVDLSGNCVRRLSGLDTHPAVETLLLDNNMLESLDGISAFPRLRVFSASSNQLESLSPIGACREVAELNLQTNRIRNAHHVVELPALATLRLAYNQLEDVPPLHGQRFLSLVTLQGNRLKSLQALLDALDRCPVLRSLELAPNPATEQKANYTLTLIKSFPSLVAVDGLPVPAEDKVAAQNFFSADEAQLLAIRHAVLGDEHTDSCGDERVRLEPLRQQRVASKLALYRDQYSLERRSRGLV